MTWQGLSAWWDWREGSSRSEVQTALEMLCLAQQLSQYFSMWNAKTHTSSALPGLSDNAILTEDSNTAGPT